MVKQSKRCVIGSQGRRAVAAAAVVVAGTAATVPHIHVRVACAGAACTLVRVRRVVGARVCMKVCVCVWRRLQHHGVLAVAVPDCVCGTRGCVKPLVLLQAEEKCARNRVARQALCGNQNMSIKARRQSCCVFAAAMCAAPAAAAYLPSTYTTNHTRSKQPTAVRSGQVQPQPAQWAHKRRSGCTHACWQVSHECSHAMPAAWLRPDPRTARCAAHVPAAAVRT